MKTIKEAFIAILFLALLPAAATAKITVEVETDEFTGVTTLTVNQPRRFFNNQGITLTYIPEENFMFLTLLAVTTDWLFLGTSAFDDQQRELRVMKADREITGSVKTGTTTAVAINEMVMLQIDKNWLESLGPGDTRIKVFGERGSFIFKLSKKFKKKALKALSDFAAVQMDDKD